MADWQLSFSERLANVVNLTSRYKSAHPELSTTDASNHCRTLESSIFASSNSHVRTAFLSDPISKQALISKVDYNLRVQAALDEFVPLTDPDETISSQEAPSAIATRLLASPGATARFGHYRNVAHFADGLFAEVFVARGSSGDFVAVKATHLSSMVAPHDAAREVRLLRKSASPNVMPLLESLHDGAGHLVLVMPFCPTSLSDLIRQTKQPGQSLLIKKVLLDMFKALAYIHSLDIIHRDVKSDNILLGSPSGPAYLTDFGIAWSSTDPASEPRDKKITDVGTAWYRAPEVLFGSQSYESSLDMYSAGCVVAETLLGRPLWNAGEAGTELTLIMDLFQGLGTPNKEVWPELDEIPDWGKVNFKIWESRTWNELLPTVDEAGRHLVSQLVRYSGKQRIDAEEACQSVYLGNLDSNIK